MKSKPNTSHNINIGYIISTWHEDLLVNCEDAFLSYLKQNNITENSITKKVAPGALEAPLIAKKMAQSGNYDAIAILAFVVDGGIYRHEFVAQAVIDGIMQVSLDTEVPILSASLTPQNFQPTDIHEDFFRSHLKLKGRELAVATLQIIRTLREIESNPVANFM